jgi:Glycoside hydrolase family 44
MQNPFTKYCLDGKWLRRLLVWAFLAQCVLRADQIVYDDALENGWGDWGWASINYNNTSPVHSGSRSISVTITNSTSQAIYIAHPAFDASLFTNLTFWINGGTTGGQQLKVQGHANGIPLASTNLPALAANTWQQFIIPLAALGITNQPNMDGFWIQDRIGSVQPTFYLDDISLGTNALTAGTNAPISITVDALANRHAISPLIYGTAFATSNQLSDLNFTINRSGGNAETRYNWQLNAHNHAADWYFESLDDGNSTPGASADDFVANSKNGGAQAMITIPMIGWMPKLGPGRARLSSYSTNKYGPQTGNDWEWFPDAGNGISITNNTHITWNNPNDANFPTNSAFQQGYVQHLLGQWGSSTNGGVGFYLMDNEESIWFSTHQDVHPIGPTMQEIRDDFFTYASMVKSNDPNALVCGPEEWGWGGYLYSGYDQQWSGQHQDYNPADYPDRGTNGGWDYMPWLLNQIQQHDLGAGCRLLDYFTLHCYPQEGNVSGADASPSTELLRNQSTRVFWDSNYIDPSWINQVIMLIPRMKSWVATNYPGTRTGITEYNWGAETNINGATAQADILGIFGREGLDLATRWTTPDASTPTYKAMKIYRNYDGNKSTFGNTSILTTVPNPDILSAFGAVRTSDGALTLMVINKDINNASPFSASIANFNAAGTAQRWQLTSANTINHLINLALTNNTLSDLLPSQSITLYVLPATNSFNLQISDNTPPEQLGIWLNGQAGQTYILQSSPDLVHWSAVGTNLLTSNSYEFLMPMTNAEQMFYRGQR